MDADQVPAGAMPLWSGVRRDRNGWPIVETHFRHHGVVMGNDIDALSWVVDRLGWSLTPLILAECPHYDEIVAEDEFAERLSRLRA